MWIKILTRAKKYTEPSGDEILQKIMATVVGFEKALTENDNPSLASLYRTIGPLYRQLLPYIKNNMSLAEAVSYIANGCDQIAQKLSSNLAIRKDVARFVKIAAIKMYAAMI